VTYRRFLTGQRLALDATQRLAEGGEGSLYALASPAPGLGSLVAKVYHQPSVERARKLAVMLAHPPDLSRRSPHPDLAWPLDLLSTCAAPRHEQIVGS
jgi:DNA-binding helix-hairpin-helix protein with protein kinase domain